MKTVSSLLLLTIALLLSACTPHSASGVWRTTADNVYGINKLVVGFDGRANFTTAKLDNASWHCFWSATGELETVLTCTASTNPEQEERFILTIIKPGSAELQHKSQRVAILALQDENPSVEN